MFFITNYIKKLTKIIYSKKNFILLLLLIVLGLISIRPILFSWNYFFSKYYLLTNNNVKKAKKYTLRSIKYNPKATGYIGMGDQTENIIKAAILYKSQEIYDIFSKYQKLLASKKYINNFYFQDFLNNLDQQKKWQQLDEMSNFFLSDKRYNKLTISILNKIQFNFDSEFLKNLCDFLLINENEELRNFIQEKYELTK